MGITERFNNNSGSLRLSIMAATGVLVGASIVTGVEQIPLIAGFLTGVFISRAARHRHASHGSSYLSEALKNGITSMAGVYLATFVATAPPEHANTSSAGHEQPVVEALAQVIDADSKEPSQTQPQFYLT